MQKVQSADQKAIAQVLCQAITTAQSIEDASNHTYTLRTLAEQLTFANQPRAAIQVAAAIPETSDRLENPLTLPNDADRGSSLEAIAFAQTILFLQRRERNQKTCWSRLDSLTGDNIPASAKQEGENLHFSAKGMAELGNELG